MGRQGSIFSTAYNGLVFGAKTSTSAANWEDYVFPTAHSGPGDKIYDPASPPADSSATEEQCSSERRAEAFSASSEKASRLLTAAEALSLEAERAIRAQSPRPQFPHGDYVQFADGLARQLGVHPEQSGERNYPLEEEFLNLKKRPLLPYEFRVAGARNTSKEGARQTALLAIRECLAKYPPPSQVAPVPRVERAPPVRGTPVGRVASASPVANGDGAAGATSSGVEKKQDVFLSPPRSNSRL